MVPIDFRFWIKWTGFDRAAAQSLRVVAFLRKLCHEYDGNAPPYGKNPKTQQYHNPKMIDKTPQHIVAELGDAMIAVMDPVFEVQMKSLRSFCSGKKDRLCSKGKYCKRTDCNRAHCAEDCIDGFYEALCSVDEVVRQQVALHRRHSKILHSLGRTMGGGNRRYGNGARYDREKMEAVKGPPMRIQGDPRLGQDVRNQVTGGGAAAGDGDESGHGAAHSGGQHRVHSGHDQESSSWRRNDSNDDYSRYEQIENDEYSKYDEYTKYDDQYDH